MKCPYCKYTNGVHWISEPDRIICGVEYYDTAEKMNKKELKDIKGEKGEFYSLSNGVKAERPRDYSSESKEIKICPNCGMLFIEV